MLTPPPTMQTKEAQQRMEEMQKLLSHRQSGDGTPRLRAGSIFSERPSTPVLSSSTQPDHVTRSINMLASEAEQALSRAMTGQETLEQNVHALSGQFKEVCLLSFMWEIKG